MALPLAPSSYVMLPQQEADMARRRLQQQGDLYQAGGWWCLRWKVDVITASGELKRQWVKPAVKVAPAAGNRLGLPAWTEKQARREAWEKYLSHLDQNSGTPQSIITVREFVTSKFQSEHVALLKRAGQTHYSCMLPHVLSAIGHLQLREVRYEHIQQLVSGMLRKTYQVERRRDKDGNRLPPITRTYSSQTAKHVRNVASAIFTHAINCQWHPGPNPAKRVTVGEMVRKQAYALSFEQARTLIPALATPEREMALALVLTSMNIAELCGLQWQHVNLSAGWAMLGDEPIPPMHIAVRQQWYRGAYGSLKKKSRKRDIPIPSMLAETLEQIRRSTSFGAPSDPVFCGRTGKPVDEHNAMARHVKPVGAKLAMPWISWHVFRRSYSSMSRQCGMGPLDRQALMGHADARMSAWYDLGDQERRRTVLDEMAAKLVGEAVGGVQ